MPRLLRHTTAPRLPHVPRQLPPPAAASGSHVTEQLREREREPVGDTGGTPHDLLALDVRLRVGGCPDFHLSRGEVHDPVEWDAALLIERSAGPRE